jgi:hypothetical protein
MLSKGYPLFRAPKLVRRTRRKRLVEKEEREPKLGLPL